jgi:hypothetical protein
MKDIDARLRERIKMLDEIDKMIKNPQGGKNANTSQSNNYPITNIPVPGRNQNNNYINSSKSIDRVDKNYSNMDLSNDLDYPLQPRANTKTNPNMINPTNYNTITHQNHPHSSLNVNNLSHITNTSSNCPTTRSHNTIEAHSSNKLSINNANNLNPNYSHLYGNFNTPGTIQSENHNNNYYTHGGNDVYSYSTKEFTEPKVRTKNNAVRPVSNIQKNTINNNSSLYTPNKQFSSKNKYNSNFNSKSPVNRGRDPSLLNINININNQNNTSTITKSPSSSAIGERLYNNAFYMKDKKERKKLEDQINFQRQRTPEITSKAKSIQRDPKKFYERLYPYHKINQQNDHDNNRYGNRCDFNQSQVDEYNAYQHNINLNLNVNSENHMGTIHDTPNFENYENEHNEDNYQNYNQYQGYDDEMNLNTEAVRLNKIYRKVPDTSIGQLNFEYKPKLDKNSLKIAEKLIPAKERLLAKKKRSKSKDYYNYSYSNSNNSFSYSKSPTRSPSHASKSPTNRTIDLYSHGLEKMKKREILYNEKKVIDGNEYKKFSFRPNIITNSPVLTGRVSAKSNQNDPKLNKSNSQDKSEFYEKTVYWKKNVDTRKEKMRVQQKNEMGNICTFKPKIHTELMPNDEKFIVKRLSQIENYVNKRRGVLQKKKEDEDYLKKKFITGEGYKCKMTIPKGFNLQTNARGRNRSKEGNLCKDGEHHEHRSLSPNHVNIMRQKLKTNEFFENQEENCDDTFERETLEYYNNLNMNQQMSQQVNQQVNQHHYNQNNYNAYNAYKDNYSQNNYYQHVNQNQKNNFNKQSNNQSNIQKNYDDEGNMHDFMSAINNLHNQLVNFKI